MLKIMLMLFFIIIRGDNGDILTIYHILPVGRVLYGYKIGYFWRKNGILKGSVNVQMHRNMLKCKIITMIKYVVTKVHVTTINNNNCDTNSDFLTFHGRMTSNFLTSIYVNVQFGTLFSFQCQ